MKWYTTSWLRPSKRSASVTLPLGRIKFIPLLYLFPGQSAALAAQFIAQAGELFLFGQELAAGGKPFHMRNDVWVSYFQWCC